jgi:hypothetical protein
MDPIRFTIALIALAGVAASVACDDQRKVGGECPEVNSPIDIAKAVCGSRGVCTYMSTHDAIQIRGAYIGLDSCGTADGAAFFGSWQVDGAPSRAFAWKGPVRTGGVFPSRGYLATPVQCTPANRCYPFATTTVAVALTDFDWVEPDDDNVFIPLHGLATIDQAFHASATLDERRDAAAARATILAEGLLGAQTIDAGVGDAFPWGRYLASVVRIVEPQDGLLGPVGWVEIRLSEPKPDAGGRR